MERYTLEEGNVWFGEEWCSFWEERYGWGKGEIWLGEGRGMVGGRERYGCGGGQAGLVMILSNYTSSL